MKLSNNQENLRTSEEDDKVQSLIQYFDSNPIEYSKFASVYEKMSEVKQAYPNTEVYQHVPGQHNTEKWLQAISDIYRKEKAGYPRMGAIRSVVGGWQVTETFDFLNWVKFYESGDHMKYKFAQLWYENDSLGPGYFLQVRKDKEEPVVPAPVVDVDHARTEAALDAEKRDKIEKQRNKIIGRLDSAEKLLRTPDGQLFSGKEFESLLETIYQLKKKIQMVNKISSSTRLYEDMIIREANVLVKQGFNKAADVLRSVAQTPAQSGEQAQGTPAGSTTPPPAAPPGDPSGAGQPGVPSGGAATPAQPPGNPTMPQSEPNQAPQPKGISDFLERMDDGQYSPEEDDDLSVEDDELEVSDQEEELLVSEAQVAPEEISNSPKPAPLDPAKVQAPKAPAAAPKPGGKPAAPAPEENLEVTEDDIKAPTKSQVPATSDIDNKLQQAFSSITVQDVIAKLEELSKIYKTREVPRQLNLVDMMLNALGIAAYFPSLSEASNKALESNNYISSRIEDILSKLRGSGGSDSDIDLKGENIPDRPDTAGIKSKLQEDADKEKARKQQRKDQEAAELDNASKETPEVEIEEDLGEPPAAPAAPPKHNA